MDCDDGTQWHRQNVKRIPSLQAIIDPNTDSYEYDYLLNRVTRHLTTEDKTTEHITIPTPIVDHIGKRMTVLRNFEELCTSILRLPDHLSSFISVELGHETILDLSKGTLRVKGNYSVPEVERVLKNYVNTYVVCRTKECLSYDTFLERESKAYHLKCRRCHHRFSVPSFRHLLEAQSTTRLLERP